MILNLHKAFFILGCMVVGCMLSIVVYAQNPTALSVIDTSRMGLDSLVKKDSLMIKHIPVLPTTYQKADAWFMQIQLAVKGDTVLNNIKTYNIVL